MEHFYVCQFTFISQFLIISNWRDLIFNSFWAVIFENNFWFRMYMASSKWRFFFLFWNWTSWQPRRKRTVPYFAPQLCFLNKLPQWIPSWHWMLLKTIIRTVSIEEEKSLVMMPRFCAFGGILGLYLDDLRFRIKTGPASFQFLTMWLLTSLYSFSGTCMVILIANKISTLWRHLTDWAIDKSAFFHVFFSFLGT